MPLSTKKINEIKIQNLMKRNNNGNPEPRNERSRILQFKGRGSLATLNPQQSQILTGLVWRSGPITRAFK